MAVGKYQIKQDFHKGKCFLDENDVYFDEYDRYSVMVPS